MARGVGRNELESWVHPVPGNRGLLIAIALLGAAYANPSVVDLFSEDVCPPFFSFHQERWEMRSWCKPGEIEHVA